MTLVVFLVVVLNCSYLLKTCNLYGSGDKKVCDCLSIFSFTSQVHRSHAVFMCPEHILGLMVGLIRTTLLGKIPVTGRGLKCVFDFM